MADLLIREVRPATDGPALCDLSRRTPMRGKITVLSDRDPDYFALYELHGQWAGKFSEREVQEQNLDTWRAVVGEIDGRIVGLIALAYRRVLFNGAPIRLAYPMDARVDADLQRQGVAKRIGQEYHQRWGQNPIDCVLAVILSGNRRAETGFAGGVPEIITASRSGSYLLHHYSLYKSFRRPRGYDFGRAAASDRDEIVDLLGQWYPRYNFAPIVTPQWFDRQMQVSVGLRYEDFHVVRDGGRIVALLALWDQRAVRRVVVLKTKGIVRMALPVLRALRPVLRWPDPPRNGQALRSLYMKFVACRPGGEPALHALVKHCLRETRHGRLGNYNTFWCGFYHSDPLVSLLSDLSHTTLRSNLFYSRWNTQWNPPSEEVAEQPAFMDFSAV